MEIHLAVNIGLLVIVAVGFIWSLLRELHIHAMQRSQEAAARQLAEHLGNVNRIIDSSNRLIEQALREISDGCDANKDANHQLVVFLRDIEQRLSTAIHDNRDWVTQHLSRNTSIYNTNSGPQGQTNQGGNVQGDQR